MTSKGPKWEVTDVSRLANVKLEPEGICYCILSNNLGDLLVWTLLGTEHIFFNTKNGHLHELYRIYDIPYMPNTGWLHNDLSLRYPLF
jgi:hypothetical protein